MPEPAQRLRRRRRFRAAGGPSGPDRPRGAGRGVGSTGGGGGGGAGRSAWDAAARHPHRGRSAAARARPGRACSSASRLARPAWPRARREGLGGVLQRGVLEGVGELVVAGVDPLVVVATVEAALAAAEHAADALEGVGELAGDDPHLVRVAAGDLREHLEVLVGEQLLRRLAPVDGVEDLLDGAGLALGLEDAGLRGALGAQDLALLLALGGEDLARLGALGVEDDGAAVTLGLHLLLHRLLDRLRRVDGLELDAVDADAPLAGGLVEHAAQLAVDLVAAGQRLLEVERADDVAQRRDGELLDALDEVGDLVDGRLRVDDLVVDDRVDAHDEVVARDDRLRRERDDLLAQVDVGAHDVDERHEEVQARPRGCASSGRGAR